MPQPLVSVVTPCLNAAGFIEKTIRSVVDQDYPALEYIVMDGGSTDGTLEILDRYRGRLRYFSAPDAGVADAVNRGFLKTQGAIFAWLGADDLYYPGAIRAAAAHLESQRDAAAIYGEADWIDTHDNTLERYPTIAPYRKEMLERECCICQPACFLRREAFESVGMLNTRLRFTSDYDLWIRLAQSHRLAAVDDLLAMSRMHPANLTLSQRRAALRETIRLLQQHYEYVPLNWIYCYLSFLRDGRDQFFEPLQPSVAVFLCSFWAGSYYNFKHPVDFWREWFVNIPVGFRKIRAEGLTTNYVRIFGANDSK
ncbi:MAG TPA: glycosyltransferase family 2 protein [Bryobacteraceae bacterium]|nr:glycosyltransferase family 2 protein [Bryobacteraceae bacterium]